MKQIVQDLKNGETRLEKIPVPMAGKGQVLIRTHRSLVSPGTERMLVRFGQAGYLEKARQQPEKVKEVIRKLKTDGIFPTVEAVYRKLGTPMPLGYSQAGEVVQVGEGVREFRIGDRVISNGPHAEMTAVPVHLVAGIPDGVSYDEAAFTVVGAIALQGMRLVNPTFGETVVVVGLGLLGLITVQLLRANGCRVVGIDPDKEKVRQAGAFGAEAVVAGEQDPVAFVQQYTEGTGADAVIITASTSSNEVIKQSAQMSRKRGRIVLVGVVGLQIDRSDFYEKELTFQVSCSYGPGRYDESYEQKGIDYPLPYVRWTEKRNFEAILEAIASGMLNVKPLVTEVVNLEEYQNIYGNMNENRAIASLLRYPEGEEAQESGQTLKLHSGHYSGKKGVIGIIGAGNFTNMTVLPALKKAGAHVKYIASSGGLSGTDLAKKFHIGHSTTDYREILHDKEVDTVMITTRHNSHARFAAEALEAEKNVFVEKPLALDDEQLDQILEAWQKVPSKPVIMVGFNRRFSPHMQAIKQSLGDHPGPIHITATMNAGFISKDFWVHDMETGGGRIIGEACHYLDLCVYLAGSEIASVCMNALGTHPATDTDNASILLRLKNGSNAVVNYFANGSGLYNKERVEVYSGQRTWVTENFRRTQAYGVKGFKKVRTRINKGHHTQFQRFITSVKEGGELLIPVHELVNVTRASFAAVTSLKEKRWVDVPGYTGR